MRMSTTKQSPGSPTSRTPPAIEWNQHKAGLEGVDKKKIEEIVQRLSKGSLYYERKQQKAKERKARNLNVKRKADEALRIPGRVEKRESLVDKNLIPQLESTRLVGHVQVCIDFDCFYAAVEAQDNPDLRGKPHAVKMGNGPHCILATSSYEARKFGVRSGMPIFIAEELCPGIILQQCRMRRYMQASKQMESVLAKYDPDYYMGSLDEAFLDITHLVKEDRSPAQIVADIREEVKAATGGLTASAGVAPNLMLAKIGADMNKPDGQTILLPDVPSEERDFVVDFMARLPLRKVPGIGPAIEGWLDEGLGLQLVGDIFEERGLIADVFTDFKTRFLFRIALGIGCPWTDSYDEKEFVRKGIGCNRTFGREGNEEKLYERLRFICDQLEKDMKSAGIVGGRTFTLRLKTSNFVSFGRSVTLPAGSMLCTADDFEKLGRKLMKAELPCELRRIGIKLHKLTFNVEPRYSIKQFFKANKAIEGLDDEESMSGKDDVEDEGLTERTILHCRKLANLFVDQLDCKVNGRIQFSDSTCATCDTLAEDPGIDGLEHVHSIVCPACHLRCFKNVPNLNAHLDECLDSLKDDLDQDTSDERKPLLNVKERRNQISGPGIDLQTTTLNRDGDVKQERKRRKIRFQEQSVTVKLEQKVPVGKQRKTFSKQKRNPRMKHRGVSASKDDITKYFKKHKAIVKAESPSPEMRTKQCYPTSPSNSDEEPFSLTQAAVERSGAIVDELSRVKDSDCALCTKGSSIGNDNREGPETHKHAIVCPVCSSRCFENETDVDSHVDECLNYNSAALRTAVQERERHYLEQTGLRGKKRKIEQTI